jgi:hypothetical protein
MPHRADMTAILLAALPPLALLFAPPPRDARVEEFAAFAASRPAPLEIRAQRESPEASPQAFPSPRVVYEPFQRPWLWELNGGPSPRPGGGELTAGDAR